MIILQELQEIMARLQENIDSATNELLRCPTGKISTLETNGRYIVYQYFMYKGKRKRKTITNDDEMIGLLLKREYLERELDVMESNLKIISQAIDKIDPTDQTEILRTIMKKYDWVTGKQLDIASQSVEASVYDWSSSPLNENFFMEEELKHYTSWGLRVRSKSELLIAELLHRYGISFKYEVPILCEGHTLTPDFQIKRTDGKTIWWEHRGLMNDPNYAKKQFQKDIWYYAEKIVPWDNLIVSYDNSNGEINLKIVEAEIKAKILI